MATPYVSRQMADGDFSYDWSPVDFDRYDGEMPEDAEIEAVSADEIEREINAEFDRMHALAAEDAAEDPSRYATEAEYYGEALAAIPWQTGGEAEARATLRKKAA